MYVKRHMPVYGVPYYGLFLKKGRGVFGGRRKPYNSVYMACIPKHVIKATHL